MIPDIDETITKSRQIIQESRELTAENKRMKEVIEKRCKQILPTGAFFEVAHQSSSRIPSGIQEQIELKDSKIESLKSQLKALRAEKRALQHENSEDEIEVIKKKLDHQVSYNISLEKELKDLRARFQNSVESKQDQQIKALEEKMLVNSQRYADLEKKIGKTETQIIKKPQQSTISILSRKKLMKRVSKKVHSPRIKSSRN